VQICLECGQAFEGNQCMVCVIRDEDISETSFHSIWVGGLGVIGTVFALGLYPPLELKSPVFYIFLALFLISAAILFVLWLCEALARYVVLTRLMIVLAAAAFVMSAAYYFLNGILDGSPPVVVQALVNHKDVSSNGDGTFYYLECTLSWKQKTIERDFEVSPKTFTTLKPGDSGSVVVHSGAFSAPWYGKGFLTNGHDAIELGHNRQ
jgi:hypothetical protein